MTTGRSPTAIYSSLLGGRRAGWGTKCDLYIYRTTPEKFIPRHSFPPVSGQGGIFGGAPRSSTPLSNLQENAFTGWQELSKNYFRNFVVGINWSIVRGIQVFQFIL